MRRSISTAWLAVALAGIFTAAPAAAQGPANNPWFEAPPLNIAHQGGEDEFPSNTLYAYKSALDVGADMLELDIGVTKDDQVVIMHDTTLDRTTNGTGTIASKTLKQIEKLDGAYWFSKNKSGHYDHDLPKQDYPFRGIATGKKKPPKGFKAADFQVPTLAKVLKEFPKTPINIEIKGRTPDEEDAEYVQNAEILAGALEA